MTSRVFLDRVQATPDKKDQLKESASSPCPERTIKLSGKPIPQEVLDDLCARFLLNIPESEKDDLIRLMFQVELAHWFYIDFHRVENPSLPEMRLPQFTARIFNAYPFLLKGEENASALITKWRDYKRTVPTYGAIICNKKLTHCILVQGSSEKSTWGFPKGKINIDEAPEKCAAREVDEEIGYDISPLINKNDFIEVDLSGQTNRLYIVRGVPLSTKFETKTRNEIRGIKWFEINNLPLHKKDVACKERLGMGAHNFFMVTPFAKAIKEWVAKQQPPKKILRRRKKANESSEEDEDSIPAVHSIRNGVSRKSESESRKSEIRRRMRERKKNLSPDSSEEETTEVVCETKSKIIDQSPGAVKRLFRKQLPKDETEPLPVKNSLIPSRTYNKMKTQKSRSDMYMPESWRAFTFDKKKILDAMDTVGAQNKLGFFNTKLAYHG